MISDAPRDETLRVLEEIGQERLRQERTHGRSREDDDKHTLQEWAWLIGSRAHELSCPWPEEYLPHPDPRRAMAEAAAIMVAAIESYDRLHQRKAES